MIDCLLWLAKWGCFWIGAIVVTLLLSFVVSEFINAVIGGSAYYSRRYEILERLHKIEARLEPAKKKGAKK